MSNNIMCLLAIILVATACNKNDLPRIPPGEGSIVYKEINQTLGYQQPLPLYLANDKTPDILLNSVLMENDDKPYLVVTVSGTTQSGNSSIVSTRATVGSWGYWSSPLKEGFTIFENATGERNWTKPQEKGYLAVIMDDGNTTQFNGLWIDKQRRYVGISITIHDKTHYGWICISHLTGTKQFLVHDAAYNKNPGSLIKAGQKKDVFEGWVPESGDEE